MPAPSSDNNAIARFDGTQGTNIKNALIKVNDAGALILPVASGIAHAEGQVSYDGETLNIHNNRSGVTMNVGQESWVKARNVSGSSIANGTPVYITGANSGLPTIAPANASVAANLPAIGITTETIPNNSNGYVTTEGVVHNLNTNAFVVGRLYVGITAGVLTQVVPTAPDDVQLIGYVTVVSTTIGEILVMPSQYILVQ